MKKLALALLAAALAFFAYVWLGIPSRARVAALATDNPGTTSLMRQREEEARKAGRTPRSVRSWVPIGRISRHLVHAVLATEDQKFFGHEGVDWDAIKESVEVNRARGGFVRGGSTITQQLAKNLFFTTHKSLVRKGRELVVARWLEADLSKRRILELYLNVIEWGDGLYGCQAAARRYYGKDCADLGVPEAAGLAAMIRSPRRLNPVANPARHARAQRRVLWLMGHAGYLGRQGLGSEPPPEVLEAEDEEEGEGAPPVPEPSAPAAETAPPTPEPAASPAAEPSPEGPAEPTPTPGAAEPTPTPTPTPPPGGTR
jgi:monofunctional biosynthetic peptidoglycan transglycosylase